MKRNNKPINFTEQTKPHDWPPLPLPDNYKNAGDPKFAKDLYNAVRRYRLVFYKQVQGLPINAGQFKAAFDSCLEIRNEFPELKEVPSTKNHYSPNEYDFMALEQWLLTAIEYVQNYYYAEIDEGEEQKKNDKKSNTCEHPPDYRLVMWYGQKYNFNNSRAIAIKLLWEAYEDPNKVGVHERDIAQAVDSTARKFRLQDLFRSHGEYHPAWRTMIKSLGHGFYCLQKPERQS